VASRLKSRMGLLDTAHLGTRPLVGLILGFIVLFSCAVHRTLALVWFRLARMPV